MKKGITGEKPVLTANGVESGYYDVNLLLPVFFLVGIGIVMVYSASSALALKKFGSDYYFLKKQVLFALLGILALVACRQIPKAESLNHRTAASASNHSQNIQIL